MTFFDIADVEWFNTELELIQQIPDYLCVFSLSVFNQGEEGTSWYIILKGSVNVVIYGKVSIVVV